MKLKSSVAVLSIIVVVMIILAVMFFLRNSKNGPRPSPPPTNYTKSASSKGYVKNPDGSYTVFGYNDPEKYKQEMAAHAQETAYFEDWHKELYMERPQGYFAPKMSDEEYQRMWARMDPWYGQGESTHKGL